MFKTFKISKGQYTCTYCGNNIGDLVVMTDGYYCWFPVNKRVGGISTEVLQYIVDKLNELNKEWDDIVQNDPLITDPNKC